MRGTLLYDVQIKWDPESYQARCSCPFFTDRDENCKHIWATLLAAQDAGKLPREYWTTDSEDFPDDFDTASDPGFATAHLMIGHRTALLRALRASAIGGPAQTPHRLEAAPAPNCAVSMFRPRAIPEPWPAGRQIFYLINVPASIQEDALCIDLATRPSGSQPGKTAPLKKIKMRYSQVAGLPDEADRLLIRMLAGVTRGDIHRIYDCDDPEIRPRFVVEGGNANDLARLMCQSGRCLLQTSPQQEDPPTIAWDDGEPWRPYLTLVPDDTGRTYRLEGGFSPRRATHELLPGTASAARWPDRRRWTGLGFAG